MHESDRRSSASIPSLDGIRAVAVALVFFAHSGLEQHVPGGLGVTIFFVLSGYLITTLMRIEHGASGGLNYRAFYLRRALRLMPPLIVVVVLATGLSLLGLVDGGFSGGGLLSTLFYTGNYYVIANDFDGLPSGIGVIWSLAVEEHFYLIYPPLALLLLQGGRSRRSAQVLAALCVVVLAWRCWLALQPGMQAYISMATDTRIDAILIGCLLALAQNPQLDAVPQLPRWREAACMVAGVLVVGASLALRDDSFRMGPRYTVQALAIAPLLYFAVVRSEQAAFRWLNARPLVYIGSISYSVYLCHHLLLGMVHRQWPQLGWAPAAALGLLLTLAVAEPVRRWIERPCAELRRRLHRRQGAREPLYIGRPAGAS